jgi:hypothetical protein
MHAVRRRGRRSVEALAAELAATVDLAVAAMTAAAPDDRPRDAREAAACAGMG